MLIGDSFIQADQIEWVNTVGIRMQQRLSSVDAEATVLSHGISSWSPLLEWNWYLKIGRRFSPKTVFLFVLWNDFVPGYRGADTTYLPRAVFSPEGRPERFHVEEPPSRWYERLDVVRLTELTWLRKVKSRRVGPLIGIRTNRPEDTTTTVIGELRQKAFEQARYPSLVSTVAAVDELLSAPGPVFEARMRSLNVGGTEAAFWRTQRPLELWTEKQLRTIAKSEPIIQGFAEDVATDGGQLVLVYLPHPWQVGPEECALGRYSYNIGDDVVFPARSGLQEWLYLLSGSLDIELLDPTDKMRQKSAANAGDDGWLYLRKDCHWSDRGHQFMANYLADWYSGSIIRQPMPPD